MGKVSSDAAAASSRRHGQDALDAEELETLPLTSTRGTAAEDQHDDDGDLPELPSYDDSEASVAAHQAGRSDGVDNSDEGHGVGGIIESNYYKRVSGTEEEAETMLFMDERLNDPTRLQRFVEDFAASQPPRFGIKISGTHRENRYNSSNKKTEETTVEDFKFTLSLRQYLGKAHDQRFWGASVVTNGDNVYRGSWKPTRAVDSRQDIEIGGDGITTSLRDWCRDFCESTKILKVFRVTRSVYGVDEKYLRKNIERVIRTTHYHGKVDVSFYTGARNVDITAPHWINTVRHSAWAFFFYLTFLWVITWPILLFITSWWTVYHVRWNWVYSLNDDEQQHVHKMYAGISEKGWMETHQNLLKSLAMEKFKGDASQFPKNISDDRVARMMGEASSVTGSSSGRPHVNEPVDGEESRIGLWNEDHRAWGGDR